MSSSSEQTKSIFDGGGNIDTAALFRAYETQSDNDDKPVEATSKLSHDLKTQLQNIILSENLENDININYINSIYAFDLNVK